MQAEPSGCEQEGRCRCCWLLALVAGAAGAAGVLVVLVLLVPLVLLVGRGRCVSSRWC
jgi:hypothetical protein